jgi:hypothetical protein
MLPSNSIAKYERCCDWIIAEFASRWESAVNVVLKRPDCARSVANCWSYTHERALIKFKFSIQSRGWKTVQPRNQVNCCKYFGELSILHNLQVQVELLSDPSNQSPDQPETLHWRHTWCLTLRIEHRLGCLRAGCWVRYRLRVFEHRVLRRI